jgi:NTP pyrophosphatase (non-canonical NTP hydrolase)
MMNPDEITENITVEGLQDYVRRMVIVRGFDNESVSNKLILLMEEMGELAKAVRKEAGMKFSETTRRTELEEELADVQIVLLDVAGKLGVNMRSAVAAKEMKNSQRTWK